MAIHVRPVLRRWWKRRRCEWRRYRTARAARCPQRAGACEDRRPATSLGYEIGISQRLPWLGKRGLESTSAAAEANASKSDFEALRREIALSALVLYDQYFIAVRSIEINRQHVELMRAMRDAATAQLRAGGRARLAGAEAAYRYPACTTQLACMMAQIESAMTRAPATDDWMPSDAVYSGWPSHNG